MTTTSSDPNKRPLLARPLTLTGKVLLTLSVLVMWQVVDACASGGGRDVVGDLMGDGAAGMSGLDGGPADGAGGPVCGDGIINGSEFCDGDNLAGESCASLGEGTGTLGCDTTTCTFDISMCVPEATGGTGGYGTGGTGTGGTGTGGTGTGGTGTGGTGTGGTGGV